jgi:hypothetical protein
MLTVATRDIDIVAVAARNGKGVCELGRNPRRNCGR